uniref:Protein asunder n=1 Tax=Strigamia maritima TaxID=126957 RepID=T1J846_STRMM
MSYPVSHKTVFVLDHGPYFLDSCKQYIEYDIFTKSRQPAFIPLPQIAKNLWTCSAEAAVEYCRIVWDIYPRDKLIRFILSDSSAHILNSWSPEEQNLNQIMNGLARCGPPVNTRKESNILHGLNAAIECLCECSRIQHAKRTSLTENASRVWNNGRVVCITALKNEKHLKNLEEYFHDALIQHNKLAASSDNLMPIHFCELVILHVFPVGDEPGINTIPRREISPIFSSEVHSIKSGRHVALKLCHLVLKHYNLSSTTVTGIPMKEEQNANSSANYDVELLHSSEAHSELIKTGYMNTEGVHIKTIKEGAEYETVTLKWCTPRTSGVEMQYCTGMFRITPIDVNSRPSSCLTNFLLNGRAVMLEMPRKSGSKVMSHTLTSHGDELFIHSLGTTRSILEDPPSISEGSGGRVTDYRIQDFGDFMKENRLAPYKIAVSTSNDLPIEKAKKQLERMTRYWPMVISNTTIFNMQHHIEPLASIIRKERLDDAQVVECKKVIYQLVAMETRSEGLPIPTMGSRGKGTKREEQYRAMWNELETLIRVHCTTENHGKVLECVQECRKPTGEETTKNRKSIEENKVVKKKEENDVVWKERDKEREVKGNEPLPTKKPRMNADDKSSGPVTLMALWANRVNIENQRRRPEFAGRLKSENNIAVLYPNLAENLDGKEVSTQIRE